jgi:hypothetical protein
MRHVLLKTGVAVAIAATFAFPVDAAPSESYTPVEYPGGSEGLGVMGFVTDYEADPSRPQIPTGPDVEIQELQDADPSTNWPPSMHK